MSACTRAIWARAPGLGKFMPIFAAFLGVFALSSLAFPGTNSFIGEFLVLTGGFGWANDLAQSWSTRLMILVMPGIVLAAAYNLRMLQRVAYGGTHNPDHSTERSGIPRSPHAGAALVFVLWIGLNPQPFTRVLHLSVQHLLTQVQSGSSGKPRQQAYRQHGAAAGSRCYTGRLLSHVRLPGGRCLNRRRTDAVTSGFSAPGTLPRAGKPTHHCEDDLTKHDLTFLPD